MQMPEIVYIPPARDNIVYAVMDKPRGNDVISKVFQGTVEKLKIERSNMGRIIIFCKTYDNNVISIYQFFKHSLEEYFTDPKGAPNHIVKNRAQSGVRKYREKIDQFLKNVLFQADGRERLGLL